MGCAVLSLSLSLKTQSKTMVRVQESSGNDKFLIDGFPRNPENLDGWNK